MPTLYRAWSPMVLVLDRLNTALLQAMHSDESVYLLGEDILDPYGGPLRSRAA